LGSRIGELIENLVAANLPKRFEAHGLFFTRSGPNVQLKNTDNTFLTEIDIFLENGDTALAVEVKSKLTSKDVEEHLQRMGKLRRYADEHHDRRKFMGAVAAGIIPDDVKSFALKKGFFVIEQSGDTAVIAVPEGFVPQEW
jgi:predicted AAA+ superfamily ATPase